MRPIEKLWLYRSVMGPDWSESGTGFVEPTAEQQNEIDLKIKRVNSGEPLAYVLGEWEFYGLPVKVGPGVLIPRPETEMIVDLVKRDFNSGDVLKAADFGSGSGCLALAIANEFKNSKVIAIEKSPEAFKYTRMNLSNKSSQVDLLHQGVEEAISSLEQSSLDFIVANPPYIGVEDENTAADVRAHEPSVALFADENGTASIQSWLEAAEIALKPGGRYYFEIGFQQGEWVKEFIDQQANWNFISIEKDLSGHPRVVVAEKVRNSDG